MHITAKYWKTRNGQSGIYQIIIKLSNQIYPQNQTDQSGIYKIRLTNQSHSKNQTGITKVYVFCGTEYMSIVDCNKQRNKLGMYNYSSIY